MSAALPIPAQTVLLLVASTVIMTFAWYGHLKKLASRPWYGAAMVSQGIALFESLLQVPANRIGHGYFILAVFVPFAVIYMQQPLKLDDLWAALCLPGAVSFIFRS